MLRAMGETKMKRLDPVLKAQKQSLWRGIQWPWEQGPLCLKQGRGGGECLVHKLGLGEMQFQRRACANVLLPEEARLFELMAAVLCTWLEVRAGREGLGEPGQDEDEPSRCTQALPGPGPGSVGGTGVLKRMAKVGSH